MKLFENVRDFITGRSRSAASEREPLRLERPKRRRSGERDDQPRFRTSATDRSESGSGETVRLKLREAFMPSQPVLSRGMFAGRLTLLEQLIEAVEDQRAHVVLYGERGIGKTSIMRVFTDIAREAEYLVIRENCGAGTTFEQLFRSVCDQIPLLYYGGLSLAETQSREGGSLTDLLPQENATESQIDRLLSEVAGTRVIVILDEFDRVDSDDFQRAVAELIKNLSDASARVQLLIAGVAENLHDLLGHAPSIRRNVIGISVDRMSDEEIAQIVDIGERHAEMRFDPYARASIVELSQGLPYIARLLCHHASLAAVDARRKLVQRSDVRDALARATREMEDRLPHETRAALHTWLVAEPRQMIDFARAGLAGGGSFELSDLQARGGTSADKKQSLLDQLAKASLIEKVEAPGRTPRYRFSEEGVGTFVLLASSAATVERDAS